jgi:hypothetical protein
MEKFCTDENWKKTLDPLVLNKPEHLTEESGDKNQENLPEEGDKAKEDTNLKHSLSESDKTESENKKIKSDKVLFRCIP